MKNIRFSLPRKSYLSSFLMLFILLFHQNCSQPGSISVSSRAGVDTTFQVPNEPSNPSTILNSYSTETFANTELNKPVEFVLEKVNNPVLSGVKITDARFIVLNGSLEPVDLLQFKFKYTPNIGFRGADFSVINGVDDKGQKISFNVKISVANPVQNFKPALAIRGMGCVQCHAKVDSNIVTDFGFGNDYYFSGSAWENGGIYGDHGKNFNTMNLKSTLQVLVPNVATPSSVLNSTGAATLAAYVKSRLESSSVESTRSVAVVQKSKVYIGAPTKSDIESAFSLKTSDRIKYFKNGEGSVVLSGFEDKETYFKNNGVVDCEGDVAIRGPLYLENLKINSTSGCRLYVIGSVFLYGEITYQNLTAENRNLQIASTSTISLGLGLTKKSNQFCEPDSRFAQDPNGYNVSSLKNRYVTFWTVPYFVTRSSPNAIDTGNAIMAEAALIERGEGSPLMDASCRPEGRSVGFERLFLNAPSIHSRYEGNIIGTLIAEYALMSLGDFKFQYDPVFDRTPVMPLLKHEVYLDVQ